MNTNNKERGQASIIIDLTDGIITVRHGTDKVILIRWTAKTGDWDEIWNVIYKLADSEE